MSDRVQEQRQSDTVRLAAESYISLLHHLAEAILDLRVQSIQLLHNWFLALRR